MFRWYVLHVTSGSENSIKNIIEERIARSALSKFFDQVIVPTVSVNTIKRGKKVVTEKRLMPGYILIKMDLNESSWSLITDIPKVNRVLGDKNVPMPISDDEAELILNRGNGDNSEVEEAAWFKIGDEVEILDGPFSGFIGTVEVVDTENNKVNVSVLIFGRATAVPLDFVHVKKKKS